MICNFSSFVFFSRTVLFVIAVAKLEEKKSEIINIGNFNEQLDKKERNKIFSY